MNGVPPTGWFNMGPVLHSPNIAAGGGPLETMRFTAEPLATLVPATGLSLMTFPEAAVLLDCIVTVPTVRPAPVMAVVAADWVSPTTLGTATGGGGIAVQLPAGALFGVHDPATQHVGYAAAE